MRQRPPHPPSRRTCTSGRAGTLRRWGWLFLLLFVLVVLVERVENGLNEVVSRHAALDRDAKLFARPLLQRGEAEVGELGSQLVGVVRLLLVVLFIIFFILVVVLLFFGFGLAAAGTARGWGFLLVLVVLQLVIVLVVADVLLRPVPRAPSWLG